MTTDILDQIDEAIDDWRLSPDAMRCSPPDDHPLAVERRENPGMATIREHAHETGLDGYAATAELWEQNKRRFETAFAYIQVQLKQNLESLGSAFEHMCDELKAAADAFAALQPKPPRARYRRYRQQTRQLHRRNG